MLILLLFAFIVKQKNKWMRFLTESIRLLLAMLLLLLATHSLTGQSLTYHVMNGNSKIGWLSIEKRDSLNTSMIKLNSEVKKRIVFLFTVIEKEEICFKDGLMQRSYIYRKINKDVKADQYTVFKDNFYTVYKKKQTEPVMIDGIRFTQANLYFSEPTNINQVYSDHYQAMLPVEKISGGYYKLKLPDGNYNYYYYTNKVCSKIRIERSLFTVEFILAQ